MIGQTADISNICEYEQYKWVMFRDGPTSYPESPMPLGRYLGPSIGVGSAMTYKILKSNGNYVCRTSVRHLNQKELASEEHKQTITEFITSVEEALGPSAQVSDLDEADVTPDLEYNDDDDEAGKEGSPDMAPSVPATTELNDQYLNVDLMLPRGGNEARGRVTARAQDSDGNPMGLDNPNPILDSRQYIVEFQDGTEAELTANAIAQSMYAQCDPDGNHNLMLDSIVDFRRITTALCYAGQTFVKNGRSYKRISTKGWQLYCQWKDRSTSWKKLDDLKESYPVEVAEYVISQDLQSEPAFKWWVPHIIKKRDVIISLCKEVERSLPEKDAQVRGSTTKERARILQARKRDRQSNVN